MVNSWHSKANFLIMIMILITCKSVVEWLSGETQEGEVPQHGLGLKEESSLFKNITAPISGEDCSHK
jgi:hypothetical protein